MWYVLSWLEDIWGACSSVRPGTSWVRSHGWRLEGSRTLKHPETPQGATLARLVRTAPNQVPFTHPNPRGTGAHAMVVGGGSGLPWSPHVLSRIEEHWDFSGPAFRRTSPSRSACACGDTCRLGGKTGVRLEVEGLKWCNDKHVLYIYI